MVRRLTPFVLCFTVTALTAGVAPPRDPSDLVVHEWGTFTSVAGLDGRAVEWDTLGGPQDLPCFVQRFQRAKAVLRGTVRMETPVLYFYSPRNTAVDVTVDFRRGTITEWYPRATITPSVTTAAMSAPAFTHRLRWSNVTIAPGAPEHYPREAGPSHYYAARETDAAPLAVGSQQEKFLFYRGVGRFPVPVNARLASGGAIEIRNTGEEPLPTVILFENRDGNAGYRIQNNVTSVVAWDSPVPRNDVQILLAELEQTLVAEGLYPREARAMIETWRDTWFEHGTRVFYIVPPSIIDRVLPLTIDPPPARVARVFVGLVEIITPAAQKDVAEAIAQGHPRRAGKYGRLLPSILDRLLPPASTTEHERLRAHRVLDPVYAALGAGRAACPARP